eukprot:398227_1
MCCGMIIGCVSIMVFGIDEAFYSDFNWDLYCNYRLLLFNTAFGLSFGPLFFKMYSIRSMTDVEMRFQKTIATHPKIRVYTKYNIIYVLTDFMLCLLLCLVVPMSRIYKLSPTFAIEKK